MTQIGASFTKGSNTLLSNIWHSLHMKYPYQCTEEYRIWTGVYLGRAGPWGKSGWRMIGPANPTKKLMTPTTTVIVAHHRATVLALPAGPWRNAPTTPPTIAPQMPKPMAGHPDTSTPKERRGKAV